MAIEYKDYYKTLGLTEGASDDEIRRAFRKLARLYHPDIAQNRPEAEDRFKELNEAYEVLGNPEKRRRYDEFGRLYRSGFGGNFEEFTRAFDGEGGQFRFTGTSGFSEFFDQLFGAINAAGGAPHGRRNGHSKREAAPEKPVAEKGDDLEGDLLITIEEAANGSVHPLKLRRNRRCNDCFGVGRVNGSDCATCGGKGELQRTETYKVKIPAGIREGATLRIPRQGEPGVAGGEPGDLFLAVRYAQHPDFRVHENQLVYDLDLAPWEAALGATTSIPTLSGTLNVKIPAGTQAGTKLRIKGRGMPRNGEGEFGDMVIVTRIQIPSSLEEKERELWEKLAAESKFRPRD